MISKKASHKNILEGLRKFKPILASCHQGQRRPGVDEGATYIYENCFKQVSDYVPFHILNKMFDSQHGY